jgi:hypothetical protein
MMRVGRTQSARGGRFSIVTTAKFLGALLVLIVVCFRFGYFYSFDSDEHSVTSESRPFTLRQEETDHLSENPKPVNPIVDTDTVALSANTLDDGKSCRQWVQASQDFIKKSLVPVTSTFTTTNNELDAVLKDIVGGKETGLYVYISSTYTDDKKPYYIGLSRSRWNGICIAPTAGDAASLLSILGDKCEFICDTEISGSALSLTYILRRLETRQDIDILVLDKEGDDGFNILNTIDMSVHLSKTIVAWRPSQKTHLLMIDNGYMWLTAVAGTDGLNVYMHSSADDIVNIMNKYRTTRDTTWLQERHSYLLRPDWILPEPTLISFLTKYPAILDEGGLTEKEKCELWRWAYRVVPDTSWGRLSEVKQAHWTKFGCNKLAFE